MDSAERLLRLGELALQDIETAREEVALLGQVRDRIGGLLELHLQPLEPTPQLGGLGLGGLRVSFELGASAGDLPLPDLDLLQRLPGRLKPRAHLVRRRGALRELGGHPGHLVLDRLRILSKRGGLSGHELGTLPGLVPLLVDLGEATPRVGGPLLRHRQVPLPSNQLGPDLVELLRRLGPSPLGIHLPDAE